LKTTLCHGGISHQDITYLHVSGLRRAAQLEGLEPAKHITTCNPFYQPEDLKFLMKDTMTMLDLPRMYKHEYVAKYFCFTVGESITTNKTS
jgi:hypothetical protein